MSADEIPDMMPSFKDNDDIINDTSVRNFECYPNGTLLYPMVLDTQNTTLTQADQMHPLGQCFYESRCYYINGSTWNGPPELTVPIYGYIMPIILTVTFISNTLIIIVLSKKHMRSPTNMVLLSMAVSDLLTVIFPAPWYFYIYTLGNTEPIMTKETGYAFEAMLENMPQIFHTASNWLTLALAMQRWVYICHVDAARVWCTMNKTRRGIAAIFIFAFLHQTTRFFDRKFEDMTIEYPICSGQHINICKVSFADWVVEDVSMNAYFVTFWSFRVLFVHLIPCISLVILNILLFRAMRQADRTRERLLNCNKKVNTNKGESRESKKIRDANTTTLMLIVVISVFLAVELPLGIIVILHLLSSTMDDFLNYEAVKSVVLIVNLSICLSYPLNFGIYCGMSRQFRETFKELFINSVTRRRSPSFQMIETGTKNAGRGRGGTKTGATKTKVTTIILNGNNIKTGQAPAGTTAASHEVEMQPLMTPQPPLVTPVTQQETAQIAAEKEPRNNDEVVAIITTNGLQNETQF